MLILGFFREKYRIGCLVQGVFAGIPEHEQYMQVVRKYMIEDYHGSEVMRNLLELVSGKEYFVVTSNADTHFQMNGFDSKRIFEAEGNFDGTEIIFLVLNIGQHIHMILPVQGLKFAKSISLAITFQ